MRRRKFASGLFASSNALFFAASRTSRVFHAYRRKSGNPTTATLQLRAIIPFLCQPRGLLQNVLPFPIGSMACSRSWSQCLTPSGKRAPVLLCLCTLSRSGVSVATPRNNRPVAHALSYLTFRDATPGEILEHQPQRKNFPAPPSIHAIERTRECNSFSNRLRSHRKSFWHPRYKTCRAETNLRASISSPCFRRASS